MIRLRAISAIILVLVGFLTTSQGSFAGNLINVFLPAVQTDDSDEDDNSGGAETVLNFDNCCLQKRSVSAAPEKMEERWHSFGPAAIFKKSSSKLSASSPFIVPTSTLLAQIGLPPRAPAVS